ncbi:hypothetical protein OAS18_02425 [Nitrospinaceae bacterium]|nr:hypothetical protein [Nitrospinaceae bacterium]
MLSNLHRHSKFFRWGTLFVFWLILAFPSSSFAIYIQLDTVADVKTNFSEGCASIKDIGNQSERLGIDAVIFGDSARNSIEFGAKPFERIFKNATEGPSVLGRGASGFISEVNDNDRQIKETILIPGVETIPFYFWSGSNYDKNLTAHNWDKRLMVIGLPTAQEYEQLPLQNSNLSSKYTDPFLKQFAILAFLFMVSVGAVYKGYARILTVPLMVLLLLLTINNHPFRSSPFDAYHGDQGMQPYQNMIDYANSKGAMVFWNHMEPISSIRKHGTTSLATVPYPDDLLKTKNYTGFQVVGDHPIQQAEAGQQWDQALMEYLQGQREQPVWGYGGNNYLCEEQNGDRLGSVRTIVLVREKNRDTLLDAIRKGRMYSVRQVDENRLSLDEFIVEDQKTGQQATLGQELTSTDFPAVKIKLRSIKGGNKTARIQVIRNGELVKQENVSLPYKLTWRDVGNDQEGRAYYRIKASVNSMDNLVSNPIFVKFSDTPGDVVASLPPPTEQKTPARPLRIPVAPKPSMPQSPAMAPASAPAISEAKTMVTPEPSPAPKIEMPEISTPVLDPPVVPPVTPPVAPAEVMAKASPKSARPPVDPQKILKVVIDGVSLRKGPGTVFPKIIKLKKGAELEFVRRTNIKLNNKNWLMVKRGNRSAYVWEGVVQWAEARPTDMENK